VNKKGIVLYFVLAILLMVVILANIVLNFITSQSKLSSHGVKRIQAFYAAQAGVNYALEQLRLNNSTWLANNASSLTFRICSSRCSALCGSNDVVEPFFPLSVNYVEITRGPFNSALKSWAIKATANYTFGE
jgi:Tfp pilus assembly protein PilX